MIENYWVLAGVGWGLFFGFILGVMWFYRFISERDDDDENGSRVSPPGGPGPKPPKPPK